MNLETGEIGFLDMGLMGEMNRSQRMALADLLVSMQEMDGYSMGKAALRLSRPLPGRAIDEGNFWKKWNALGSGSWAFKKPTSHTASRLCKTFCAGLVCGWT